MADISTKPYLIRALHQWCADSGYTPQLLVSVDGRTRVPQAFVKDGQIVLNVSAEKWLRKSAQRYKWKLRA